MCIERAIANLGSIFGVGWSSFDGAGPEVGRYADNLIVHGADGSVVGVGGPLLPQTRQLSEAEELARSRPDPPPLRVRREICAVPSSGS